MRQTVAILKDHPDIQEILNDITDGDRKANEQIDFLKSRAKAISKAENERAKKLWADISSKLRGMNVLPSWFDEGKCHLHNMADLGILVACSDDEIRPEIRMTDITELIKGLKLDD